MKLNKKEIRQRSFVNQGQKLIEEGNTELAMKKVEEGLEYYSARILNSFSPYSAADAGLIVISLRHLADEAERNNPGAKEFYNAMMPNLTRPELKETTKIKKPNR